MELFINILAMWTPGPLEMIVILVVAVLLFGKRLPDIARSIGRSLTEFKKGIKETKDDLDVSKDDFDLDDKADESKDD